MEMKQASGVNKKSLATYSAILVPIGIAINLVGNVVCGQLRLPIYMDCIGTAVVAAIMGPWIGGLSGFLTMCVMALMYGDMTGIVFGLVNGSVGLIIGYAIRWKKFSKVWHLAVCAALIAFVASVLGSIFATMLYGGIKGGTIDFLVAGLMAAGNDILSATFWARLPINILDKGICVIASFLVLKRLPDSMKILSGAKRAE